MIPMIKNRINRCEAFGKEVSMEEYESYDGLCWECWDDRMTEGFAKDLIARLTNLKFPQAC